MQDVVGSKDYEDKEERQLIFGLKCSRFEFRKETMQKYASRSSSYWEKVGREKLSHYRGNTGKIKEIRFFLSGMVGVLTKLIIHIIRLLLVTFISKSN